MSNGKNNSFITYEVSLYFEKDSELKIKNLIRQIADVTQNFYRIEKEIPPHITLGMFKATETQKSKSHLIPVIEAVDGKCGTAFQTVTTAFHTVGGLNGIF